MLILDIKDQSGHPDISVTSKDSQSQPPHVPDWPSVDVPAVVRYRNVAMIPVSIHNNGAETVFGPKVTEHSALFTNSQFFPGVPILKDNFRITVMNEQDNIMRVKSLSVPISGLIKDGQVQILPNETVFIGFRSLWFDKTMIANRGMAEMYWLQLELVIPGTDTTPLHYSNHIVMSRFYSFQIRHSEQVDIP